MTEPMTLTTPMTLEEARAATQRIREHRQALWFEARDLYHRRGWEALSYDSFEHWALSELGIQKAHAYRLLDAADIRAELTQLPVSIPGDTIGQATERQLRELKPLPPPVRAEVAQRINFAATPVRELRQIVKQATAEIAAKKVEERRAVEVPKPTPLAVLPASVTLAVADASALPLADGTVDLICTSPPYGLSKEYGSADDADDWWSKMRTWVAEMYRVAREHGRLAINVPLDTTIGGYRPTYAQTVQTAYSVGWTYRSTIVWSEPNVSKTVARGSVDSATAPHIITPVEMIALFSKGTWKRETDTPSDLGHEDWLAWTNGLWAFNGESRAWEEHPAPFPEELPRRLIKLLSFPGDTVLDPFVGSGTTALAAHNLGRQCYGYDLSETYINSAKRRLGGMG